MQGGAKQFVCRQGSHSLVWRSLNVARVTFLMKISPPVQRGTGNRCISPDMGYSNPQKQGPKKLTTFWPKSETSWASPCTSEHPMQWELQFLAPKLAHCAAGHPLSCKQLHLSKQSPPTSVSCLLFPASMSQTLSSIGTKNLTCLCNQQPQVKA